MPGKVFVNYRRGDEAGYTQALFQQLEAAFGRAQLFMDVEGYIKAGDDFVRELEAQIAACDVLLAVIGPRWIDARDDKGQRRLDNPDDFVRIEIASALDQGKRVIPVLVNNAPMLHADGLPEPLRRLVRRNAVRLTPERFLADCRGLIDDIRAALKLVDEASGAEPLVEDTAAKPAPPATTMGEDKPPAATSGAKGSNLTFGMIFLLLAGVSAWVTLTLFRDAESSRAVVLLFSAVSLFFFFVAFVALRVALQRRGGTTIASGK